MSLNAGDWSIIQQVITPTSQILDATVARLYKSGIGGRRWEYTRKLGAAVLVSENTKLSIVLIDLSTSTVSFQYEFANPFYYFELKPYFHSFQMDETKQLGGLSFANEMEGQSFFGTLCKTVFYCDKCEASCFHGSGFDHQGVFCCSCNSDANVPASNRFTRSMTLPTMNAPPTVTNKIVNTIMKPGPSQPLQKSSTFNLPPSSNHPRQAVNENILGQSFAKNFIVGGPFTRDSRSESEPTSSSAPQPVLPPKFNRGSNRSQSPPCTSPYSSPASSNRSSLRSSVSTGSTPIVSITPGAVPLVSIPPPGIRRSQSMINPTAMMPASQLVQPVPAQSEEPASTTLTKKELKKLEKEQKERERKELKQKEKERKEQKEREKKEEERIKKEKEKLEKEKKKLKKSGGVQPPMEISGPTDFQHVSSIGYNQLTHTFEIKNIPPQWKQIFRDAGITKRQLQNAEMAPFIYDVCVNGNQSVQSFESFGVQHHPLTNRPPPPPPAPAPPQPPVFVPTNTSYDHDRPQTPPIPEDELPSAASSTSSSPNSSRSGLLSEIHAGIQLRSTKSVNENIQGQKEPEGTGLAETLARAMMQRRGVLQEHQDIEDEEDDWSD